MTSDLIKKILIPFKVIVVLVWIACLVNVCVPFAGPWQQWLIYVLYVLVGVHVCETLFFLPRMRASGENVPVAAFMSCVFGMLHNYRYLAGTASN